MSVPILLGLSQILNENQFGTLVFHYNYSITDFRMTAQLLYHKFIGMTQLMSHNSLLPLDQYDILSNVHHPAS